jgi:hypothetical protein
MALGYIWINAALLSAVPAGDVEAAVKGNAVGADLAASPADRRAEMACIAVPDRRGLRVARLRLLHYYVPLLTDIAERDLAPSL